MRAIRFALICLLAGTTPAPGQQRSPRERADQAQAILRKHCFECHGKDPKKIKGDGRKILDHALLLDKERKIVVPKSPDESLLIQQVEEEKMPPDKRPKVPAAERRVLRERITAGAPPFEEDLAARVKEVFRTRCFQCHGSSKTNAEIKILDHDLLVNRRKKVIPGKPDESPLFQLISSATMPPRPPPLSLEDIATVRRWILDGAPPFPADLPPTQAKNIDAVLEKTAGIDYVLKKILEHVRTLTSEDRRFVRYFSINHLLTGGATRDELDLHRDALAKAVNHLSWEKELVQPRAIDAPTNSIFCVDLRRLGWHKQPFQRMQGQKVLGKSPLNLFDLVLLEYPYGVLHEGSETFERLAEEFLAPAGQVRPVPYVRADWFVSVATQPPLYEDLLQLPFELKDLETRLGADAQDNLDKFVARRAGVSVSGVSQHNRVVERHPTREGAYWKSFDFRSSKGRENVFADPLHLNPTGGEMIFSLPNGLQGYFLANGKGSRLAFAPTDIVTDKFAEDKTVRNGLACMRCHDSGMKPVTDAVRPALEQLPGSAGLDRSQLLRLYAPQAELDQHLNQDTQRFLAALEKAVGRPPAREPLAPVSRRFLDAPLPLAAASAELGLAEPAGLQGVFRLPRFTSLGLVPLASEGVVRRDMWEDYYDQVVRQLGLGVPLVPLDGVTRPDIVPNPPPFDVELKTGKKNNVFEPGDKLEILVTNGSGKDLFIELIGTSAQGAKVILAPSNTRVAAGQTFRFPEQGKTIRIKGGLGKEQLTVFACDTEFPAGKLLRGQGVADRVVHPFFELRRNGQRSGLPFDPARVVKKTIEIETR